MIKITRPTKHRVWIATDGQKVIGKITYYGAFGGTYLTHAYGRDIGGTKGNPGVKYFTTLDAAKAAILKEIL